MTTRIDVMRRALLGEAIIEHLTSTPMSTDELAAHLGYNRNTIYGILSDLREDDRLYQQRTPLARGTSLKWVVGVDPVEQAKPAAVAKHYVTKAWPLHHVRDPLVAAFYGEARHG